MLATLIRSVSETATRRLAGLALLGLLAVALGPAPVVTHSARTSDITTYRALVERLRDGQPYHAAVAATLRPRGYALREVFNWRTPLHFSLVAALPAWAGRALLVLLSAAAAAALMASIADADRATRLIALAMLAGVVTVSAAPDIVYLAEAWSGALLGCAVGAQARGQRALAMGCALLALAFRELAAPYCVACTLMAARDRDLRAVAAWLAGAALYAGYFAWHLTGVVAHQLPDERAHTDSWLHAGGLPFLLTTMHWTGWWFLAPLAWTAVLLVLVTAGLTNAGAPRHARVAGLVYAGFFMVAGQPFDHYWGLVASPIWALLAGLGAVAIVRRLPNGTSSRRPAGARS